MLVLKRQVGQGLTIGSNIRVVVINESRGEIQLGIDAPKSVPIVRDDAVNKKEVEPIFTLDVKDNSIYLRHTVEGTIRGCLIKDENMGWCLTMVAGVTVKEIQEVAEIMERLDAQSDRVE